MRRWTPAPSAKFRGQTTPPRRSLRLQAARGGAQKTANIPVCNRYKHQYAFWGPQDSEGSAICRKSERLSQAFSFETNSKAALPLGNGQLEVGGKYQQEPKQNLQQGYKGRQGVPELLIYLRFCSVSHFYEI